MIAVRNATTAVTAKPLWIQLRACYTNELSSKQHEWTDLSIYSSFHSRNPRDIVLSFFTPVILEFCWDTSSTNVCFMVFSGSCYVGQFDVGSRSKPRTFSWTLRSSWRKCFPNFWEVRISISFQTPMFPKFELKVEISFFTSKWPDFTHFLPETQQNGTTRCVGWSLMDQGAEYALWYSGYQLWFIFSWCLNVVDSILTLMIFSLYNL